jgi:hypothetical protein
MQKKAKSTNATRWNSQLETVRCVCRIDRFKFDYLPGVPDSAQLTVRDHAVLKEFAELMSAFEEATDGDLLFIKLSSSLCSSC